MRKLVGSFLCHNFNLENYPQNHLQSLNKSCKKKDANGITKKAKAQFMQFLNILKTWCTGHVGVTIN